MASSLPRTRNSSSVSSVETALGTHSFKITSYSLHKKVSVDKLFCSAPFAVGGHDWRIRYCYSVESLGGFNRSTPYDSLYLELIAEAGKLVNKVSAIYKFRMVNPVTGASVSRGVNWPEEFSGGHLQGFASFVRADEVDKYVQDDSLLIECDVMVIKEVQVKETQGNETSDIDIQVPPSDLSQDLESLLESEEGADVTFKVQGEVFRAHKIVLAMRSPVFKAQLFGPMSDGKGMAETEEGRTIQGMDPATFRGLLHFIYTDSFPPPMDEDADDQDQHEDMVKHLLVAADRYGMERMKLICESILCKSLDVGRVAYTLALAGQHHCSKLKDACIEFIISSDGMDAVLASQGYEHLKRACPDVALELWEKTVNKSRVMRSSSSKSTYQVPY